MFVQFRLPLQQIRISVLSSPPHFLPRIDPYNEEIVFKKKRSQKQLL